MALFGQTINGLEQRLNYASLKNKTIANNIANVDTPGYKSQSVSFKETLDTQMQNSFEARRTHPAHLSFESVSLKGPGVVTSSSLSYASNGNNVDIDKEMAELAQNQIYYQGLVDRLNGKFSSLQTVIRGGR